MARKRLEATAFLDHFANGELADCPLPPIAVRQHFFDYMAHVARYLLGGLREQGDGYAALGDDDFFPFGDAPQELGKSSLRLVGTDGCHGISGNKLVYRLDQYSKAETALATPENARFIPHFQENSYTEPMRRLLRQSRRLLLGLFLLGLGYVLYQRLPPVERWSVRLEEDGRKEKFSFSPDGRFVFSHRFGLNGDTGGWDWWAFGPFRKRDVATGQLLVEASTKEFYQSHSVRDFDAGAPIIRKRFWAGLPKTEKGILELFEVDSGKERRLPIKNFSGERRLIFSPPEDMVAIFCCEEDPLEKHSEADIFVHALPGGEQVAVLSGTTEALFSPDGSYFVYLATSPEGPCLRLWDTHKRQSAGIMPGASEISEISPNGRFLLAGAFNKDDGKTKIWDLSDLANPRGVAILSASDYLKFTPDSRALVELPTKENPNVVFWDSATGLEEGRVPAPFFRVKFVFSCDSRLLAIREGPYAGNFPVAVIDMTSRQVLWNKRLGDPACMPGNLLFRIIPGDVDTLFLNVFDEDLNEYPQLRNARTGDLLASFSMQFSRLRSSHSGDGQRILIYGHGKWPQNQKQGWFWETLRNWLPSNPNGAYDLVRVIDVPTLREVFHLADSYVKDAQLSPDGETLLTVHPNDPAGPHLRCWDIPARHPWFKIVGIPAAVGLVLVLLGRWRQARKARRQVMAVPAPPSGSHQSGA